MKELPGSRHGEGIGGPVENVEDPNNPSFDPANHKSSTDDKIRFLLGDDIRNQLSRWESTFLMEMYGKVPLTRTQHLKVWKIYKRHIQPDAE